MFRQLLGNDPFARSPFLVQIRPVQPSDVDALYRIALLTGDSGKDATSLYKDGNLVGHIWAAPYAELEPESCFVAEDGEGVAAYIVGTTDTERFDDRLEAEWWPRLRPLYPDPRGTPHEDWSTDELRAYTIHHPRRTQAEITGPYPSHLHINLLPRLQGQGVGAKLIDRWLARMREAGSRGVHLGVSPANERALRFYAIYGFTELPRSGKPYDPVWFAMNL